MTLETGSWKIQCQARVSVRLSRERWHHVALTYSESLGTDLEGADFNEVMVNDDHVFGQ